MTPQPGTSEPPAPLEEGAPAPTPPLGTMLREARLRRGLTLAEASADTRINPAYLEAIEGERWELMPAPVYARGFFRSYARYLGLPADAIERLVPRDLPRPLELEPLAGLRKRAAEAPLSLPTLPALRLPTLGRPPRSRRSSQARDRLERAEGVVRAPPEARAPAAPRAKSTFAPLQATVRRAAGGVRQASRTLEGGRAPQALRHIESRTAAIAAAGVVVGLLVLLAVLRLDGGADRLPSVAGPTGGGQVAGPEPSSGASSAAPVPFKEGEMPDLAGMSRKDAEGALTRLGLTYVVIEVANATVPPGTVYNHSPQAGKSIKRGDAVTLLVARAP